METMNFKIIKKTQGCGGGEGEGRCRRRKMRRRRPKNEKDEKASERRPP